MSEKSSNAPFLTPSYDPSAGSSRYQFKILMPEESDASQRVQLEAIGNNKLKDYTGTGFTLGNASQAIGNEITDYLRAQEVQFKYFPIHNSEEGNFHNSQGHSSFTSDDVAETKDKIYCLKLLGKEDKGA